MPRDAQNTQTERNEVEILPHHEAADRQDGMEIYITDMSNIMVTGR